MEKPIGATDTAPLVVSTSDIARFVVDHLEVGQKGKLVYNGMVERIRMLRERGQILHGVSYETLKRITDFDGVCVADNCAEAILLAYNKAGLLGEEIPLYRNPALPEDKYFETMKKWLKRNWDQLLDGEWEERELLAYIESYPEMPL